MSTEYPILKDYMNHSDDTTIYKIGARSSFVFIGTKDEFFRDIGKINYYYKNRPKNIDPNYINMEDRLITSIDNSGIKECDYIISITGNEIGKFLTLNEYKGIIPNGKQKLVDDETILTDFANSIVSLVCQDYMAYYSALYRKDYSVYDEHLLNLKLKSIENKLKHGELSYICVYKNVDQLLSYLKRMVQSSI